MCGHIPKQSDILGLENEQQPLLYSFSACDDVDWLVDEIFEFLTLIKNVTLFACVFAFKERRFHGGRSWACRRSCL